MLALRQAELDEDALILCDNESVLKVIRKWVGQGGRASLARAPDADILGEILELLRARINAGRATFFFKVKSHRGEALNERADTLAEMGRERPEDEPQEKDKQRPGLASLRTRNPGVKSALQNWNKRT